MVDRYVNITGGDDSSVEWWPWNTLQDILTRPLMEVDMLSDKYADSGSVLDLEHVVNALRDIFVYNTSLSQMSTQSALHDMMGFTTAMDWMVYLKDKILAVLQNELKLYMDRSGLPSKVDTIHNALQSVALDAEGTKLLDRFYADLFHIYNFRMDDIYSELKNKPEVEALEYSDDTVRIDMGEQEVRKQMASLLGIAKWHALVMDALAKKKVLHDVFISSAMLAEHIATLHVKE